MTIVPLTRPSTFRTFKLPGADALTPQVFVRRHELPKELLAAEADTQGWDAASAVRLSQVNEALAKTGVSPAVFQASISDTWTTEGNFGPWRMTRGGSGSIVFLRTPITSAAMKSPMGNMTMQNGWATIQVKLNYLPHFNDTDPDPTKGDRNDLLTDTNNRSADDPAVVVQQINFGDKPVPEELKALFQAIMAKWYNANLNLFNYVFAVVSLNQVASAPQFQWLKPTYTSYAYYDGPRDDPSEDVAYFGVLTMNGRSPDGLANQLPASAIPPGQGAALLIGMRLVLENMILPGVQGAFPGSTPSDFTLTNGNTSIQLKNDLAMNSVRVGLIDYYPVAQEFILQIVGDEIQTRSKIHVPISPGIDAYVTTETWYRVTLVTKDDGTQTLSWVESRPAKKDHYYTKETWVVITEVIVSVIGAVAALVAGALLSGIVRVVVIIIIGIVAGIAAATPELVARIIADGAAKALPPIEHMLSELMEPVEWPATTGFVLTQAELNGSLQLSGSFATS